MLDRNGTIKRLQDSLKVVNGWCCRTDSMDDPIMNVERAIEDALELLMGQEPRVLTLEEARTYEVVWPEDKGEGELHPLIVENNMNDSKYYKYGVHWRVWSAKPTDEQRKAVKWE